ncbi:MAG: hypothetical protein M1828_003728 [Chrysothrix sp. TS-e1954]|nr:MAG: hypothetical protein M1828_003728 [Chrysothrix sp. TS-e1954]
MGVAFDEAPERPENIDIILNGLDRYNPESTVPLQEYVTQQCETQTYDCYANLALLKLYQFNPHLSKDEIITAILVKTLTTFPSPDFSLCLHLLQPSLLAPSANDNSPLAGAVQKLNVLNNLLSAADYSAFWSTFRGDALYAELVAEVSGFEELMRVRIAATVSQAVREVQRSILEDWLELKGKQFEKFVGDVCGWKVETSGMVKVPLNKDNEAKGVVVRENVKFDQFSRIIRRAYEQPA